MNFICFVLFVTECWLGFAIVVDLVIQCFNSVSLLKYSLVSASRRNGVFNAHRRHAAGANVEYSEHLCALQSSGSYNASHSKTQPALSPAFL